MNESIKIILEKAKTKIEQITNKDDIDNVRLEIFGKKGFFTNVTKLIPKLSSREKPEFGKNLNEAKRTIDQLLVAKKEEILTSFTGENVDISSPSVKTKIGHLHLVSQAIDEIIDIFKKLGFSLQSYPEVDWDYFAFEVLNMPKGHQARDEWETFFVKSEKDPIYGNQVLTPHTSNGQVRELLRIKNPPVRMLNISRCYRRQIDVSHTPMFHQFEGLLVDKNVSISQLKGTFDFFTTQFFGIDRVTRLRPHHFRFTEPSFEVDVTCGVCIGRGCRICKSGWLELGGAGMVHPNVLKAGNVDPEKFSGFAFGWGIERTIAMRTNVPDIRLLFQNDLRFNEQF